MATSLLPLLAATSMLACDPALPERDSLVRDIEQWPAPTHHRSLDPALEARVDALLAEMSVEDRVGQLIQADIGSIEPEDLREYRLGAILNGGNSAPNDDVRASPAQWLALADQFFAATNSREDGRPVIPLLWGTDAVHGHNNVVGATVFPHNIGLGAARAPTLIRRIGEATALEIVVTGQEWSFAPTLAVARDDRWGRTYESYSEDPSIVAAYAEAMIEGLQGALSDPNRLRRGRVLATAKHFIGDGGTHEGIDQGNAIATERELALIHGAGYPRALAAGAEVIMASFSSWQGCKVHGSRYLLTSVLKERMGFDGFLVGDWNAHAQVAGCSPQECPHAIMAGIDMFMAPNSWRTLYHSTLRNVRDGEITEERLEDAVRRILRVKLRAGLFEAPKPSARPFAGASDLLGHPAHRAIAREAVQRSAVLLKNNQQVLPISAGSHVLVLGPGADDMQQQTGGWTLSWQGTGNTREHFPNGQTIWEGIADAVRAAGGTAQLSRDGTYEGQPDVAIVVYGEAPYAEFQGDRRHVAFVDHHQIHTNLTNLKASGIPTVSVFLSGRPLWVNPHLNASDAFVAAWLPGTEGGAIAELLLAPVAGARTLDFTGRLSFSWPATPWQTTVNRGDTPYEPLFAFGYGLSLDDAVTVPPLDEADGARIEQLDAGREFLVRGTAVAPWYLELYDASGSTTAIGHRVQSPDDALRLRRRDHLAQEDAVQLTWTGRDGGAIARLEGTTLDLRRAINGDMALKLVLDTPQVPADATLAIRCAQTCGKALALSALLPPVRDGWTTLLVPLRCFDLADEQAQEVRSPLEIRAGGAMDLGLHEVALAPIEGVLECPPMSIAANTTGQR
ncbi:MAG: glycoside hydrolase family 3 N-terminal domain-containing protein [Pseudomonadota bacterium]